MGDAGGGGGGNGGGLGAAMGASVWGRLSEASEKAGFWGMVGTR